MTQSPRLEGKVAVITGGARGMGAAHARAFASQGASVAITDILVDEGQRLAEEIGKQARFFEHDVSDATAWARVIAATEEAFGPVNVLVNNAGIGAIVPLETMDEAEYRRVVDVNQVGVFLGLKAVVPTMQRAGGGSIINVSSVAGLIGPPHQIAYAASKWAVTGMTKVAAKELGPISIRVNSIHPGVIDTPIYDSLPDEAKDAAAAMVAQTPLGRSAEPDEITGLVAFLASDESAYVTGAAHVIDGGLMP